MEKSIEQQLAEVRQQLADERNAKEELQKENENLKLQVQALEEEKEEYMAMSQAAEQEIEELRKQFQQVLQNPATSQFKKPKQEELTPSELALKIPPPALTASPMPSLSFPQVPPSPQITIPPASSQNSSASAPQPRIKFENAIDYLEDVKREFSSQPIVYNQFLDIMKDFKAEIENTEGVIERVTKLFEGHDELIARFNVFLPPGYKIEIPVSPQNVQTTRQGPSLDQSRQYVQKVKTRFITQPEVYRSFLDILNSYHKMNLSLETVHEQIARLFCGHPDLIEEFTHFLPDPIPKGIASVLQEQHPDGYWLLTDSLLEAVEINLSAEQVINDVLIKAGCQSLGDATLQIATLFLATSLVTSYISKHGSTEEYVAYVNRAQSWLAREEENFPMLAYRLDLGISWQQFATSYLAKNQPT